MIIGKHIQCKTRTPACRLAGILVCLGLALCFSGTALRAETFYVGDEINLTVRSGPGTDRKILEIVSTGEKMEMLEDGEEWVFVRLGDGQEGWVLKRYLSKAKPSRLKLEELQKTHGRLSTRSDELVQENDALKSANTKLTTDLEDKTKALDDLTRDYEELKKTSDASSFQLRKNIFLLISGAGILFFGIILGLVMKRQRRKSMYMI